MARPSDLVREMELPVAEREILGRKLDWIEGILTSVAIAVNDAVDALNIVTNLPTGGIFIGMFNASCPSGWTRVTALDARFPRGATTYGGTGGASTHGHSGVNSHDHTDTPAGGSHIHTVTEFGQDEFAAGAASARRALTSVPTDGGGAHSHSTENSGAGTSTGSNLPPYLDIVMCAKD